MVRPPLLFLSSLVCVLGASHEWEATGEPVSVAADQMVIKTKRGEVTAARVDVNVT